MGSSFTPAYPEAPYGRLLALTIYDHRNLYRPRCVRPPWRSKKLNRTHEKQIYSYDTKLKIIITVIEVVAAVNDRELKRDYFAYLSGHKKFKPNGTGVKVDIELDDGENNPDISIGSDYFWLFTINNREEYLLKVSALFYSIGWKFCHSGDYVIPWLLISIYSNVVSI